MSTKHHWIEHDITEQVQAWHDDADGSDWLELAATTVEVRVEEGIDPGTSTTIVRLRLPRFFGQRMRAAFADATDPWALPDGLEWKPGADRWYIADDCGGALWFDSRIGVLRGSLLYRLDAEYLIDLLDRRNAAEPEGPR